LSVVFLSVSGLNCASQSKPMEITAKIERQLRVQYKLPPEVPIAIGPRSPSPEWPGFQAFTVTVGEDDYALMPDGAPCETTVFYKAL